MNTTIDSKDQNLIEHFMTCAYQINEGDTSSNLMQTARLLYYNMSIEAQHVACRIYQREFGKNWR